MVTEHEDRGVAHELFGGFITIGRESGLKGRLDPRNPAPQPLTDAIRVPALEQGITETGTLEPMEALRCQTRCSEMRTR